MTWFNLNNQIVNTPAGTTWFQGTGLTVNLGSATGVAHYDALQIHLSQRFTRDLQYTLAYSWSHTLDDSNGPFSVTGGNARIFVLPGRVVDLSTNYGNSDQDQRHSLTLSTLYELPIGRGKRFGSSGGSWVNSLIAGWQWNNIVSIGSGTPFDIFVNGKPSNRPDYLGHAGNGSLKAGTGSLEWMRFAAFTPPPVNQSGVFTRPGNLPRNFFSGPGMQTWDMSLFKTVDLGERLKLQIRAEGYNILNSPQFTNPDANLSDGPIGFGAIHATRAFSERQVQLALRITF
jgi:hypothetical protein